MHSVPTISGSLEKAYKLPSDHPPASCWLDFETAGLLCRPTQSMQLHTPAHGPPKQPHACLLVQPVQREQPGLRGKASKRQSDTLNPQTSLETLHQIGTTRACLCSPSSASSPACAARH